MTSKVTKLAQCVLPPSHLVKHLNWNKKGILALDISQSSVGIAFAPHPSKADYFGTSSIPVATVPRSDPKLKHIPNPLVLNANDKKLLIEHNLNARRKVNSKVAKVVREVVDEFDVGAYVVAWPLLQNGRMGAEAGRVLFLLDYFTDDGNIPNILPLLSKKRPAALWEKNRDNYDDNAADEMTAHLLLEDFMKQNGMIKFNKGDKISFGKRNKFVESPNEFEDLQARIRI